MTHRPRVRPAGKSLVCCIQTTWAKGRDCLMVKIGGFLSRRGFRYYTVTGRDKVRLPGGRVSDGIVFGVMRYRTWLIYGYYFISRSPLDSSKSFHISYRRNTVRFNLNLKQKQNNYTQTGETTGIWHSYLLSCQRRGEPSNQSVPDPVSLVTNVQHSSLSLPQLTRIPNPPPIPLRLPLILFSEANSH